MTNSKSRQAILSVISDTIKGQQKLAEMLRDAQRQQPTAEQLKEVAASRDTITQKMASLGIIPHVDAPAFRESMDTPGGTEQLIAQLLDRAESDKTANFEPSSGLGTVAVRNETDQRRDGIPVVGYNHTQQQRRPSYQSPYSR